MNNDLLNIIVNKKEFDLDNAFNAVQDVCKKCESEYLSETDFIFDDSDKRILNKDEVQRLSILSKNLLHVARNEIFARHGYIFGTKEMIDHFSRKKWYKPAAKTVNLSDIEKKNVELIRAAEN